MEKYRKIYKFRRFMGTEMMFLGADHLLHVKQNGYSEEYRRFFLKDIQAITVYKTRIGFVLNMVFGVLAFIGIVIALFIYNESMQVFDLAFNGALIIGAISVLPIVVNALSGPTAEALVTTLTSREVIGFSGRFRKAMKLLRTVAGHIEAIQGELRPPPPPPEAEP